MWRMVPGLADSAGVSFESVNRPGNYLRHKRLRGRARRQRLNRPLPGRRHLLPHRRAGRQLLVLVPLLQLPRPLPVHSNYVLRIDFLSASSLATDRQSATFPGSRPSRSARRPSGTVR
nr:AbfB domain-containing protein [Micromonospora humidisoli]